MTVKLIQSTMSQGEATPKLHSRTDIEQFRKSLKTCLNWLIMRHGGLTKRSGTRFIGLAKHQDRPCRLLPFVFSAKQHYMIELAEGAFRFYSEMAQIQQGGSPYEVAHTFAQSELWELDYTHSADVMTLVHGDHAPSELKRMGETNWSLGDLVFATQPDDWGVGSYPKHVTYYMERITYANWSADPQGFAFSQSGKFDVLKFVAEVNPDTGEDQPIAADDAMKLSILAGQVNEVQWIAEGEDLLIGTATAARIIMPSDRAEVFGPANNRQKRQVTFGSKAVRPVQIGEALLYVGVYGKNLREYLYDPGAGKYIAPDLTIINEHLFSAGIEELAYAQDPDSICWVRTADGGLVDVTYERDQQILGCGRVSIGGAGKVEAIGTKPGVGQDELWLQVVRTLNGQEVRTIEVLDPPFEGQAIEDGFFVDCGVAYEGAAVDHILNLPSFFEGQEVAILADGVVMPRQEVVGQKITLPNGLQAEKIIIGFPYRAHGETLEIVDGAPDGTAFGRTKRLASIGMDVLRTADLQVSQLPPDKALEDNNYEDLTPMIGDELTSNEVTEHTGLLTVSQDGWSETGSFHFWSDKPLPCTIRAIKTEVDM